MVAGKLIGSSRPPRAILTVAFGSLDSNPNGNPATPGLNGYPSDWATKSPRALPGALVCKSLPAARSWINKEINAHPALVSGVPILATAAPLPVKAAHIRPFDLPDVPHAVLADIVVLLEAV